MSEIVQSELHGAVAVLRLNRPEALNALSDELLGALCAAFDDAEHSPGIRCVVLCGAGRAFAAGADLAGLRALSAEDVASEARAARWARLRAARLPVIAAVHGWCLGGGCELALTCDIVVAAENARFGLPETGLGLIPGAGGTQRLPRIAGSSLALEMILAGRSLTAREALLAGICSRVVAPEALEREALALAARIAQRPALAVRLAREAVQLAFEAPLEAGLRDERRLFALAFASDDAREGMDAFVERRAPAWGHGS
jgi:enoyl-CoA hydratase